MGKKVGVLVVDDSPICRQLICDALAKDPDLEVLGTCADGQEAVRSAAALKPGVITMDVDMPVMDGLSAVEAIMSSETPTPILMLTADPRNQAPELTCRALEVGALALQVKPSLDAGPEAWNLAREVKLLSSVKVIRHLRAFNKRNKLPGATVSSPQDVMAFSTSPVGIVGIVSSTGGPQVIHKLLSELPGDFPAPIVVVQHINASFAESLAGWLAASSKLKIKLATDGASLVPGEVLIAPPGRHMVIPMRGKVTLALGEPKDGHLPSGSMLLESAAKAYGRRTVGMVLTGMGSDGAEGMSAIKIVGGRTIVQSEESCVVYGMPGAAVARNAVDHVVHADELSAVLLKLARGEPVAPAAR
ncbi:MAG TPA: chemotaxis-specific protein-glutamate methyltransferase CheB [Myxococcaceae bacterium]|nr:chemotaxis-specific protein-glutamate methyltransferase CheB [Myxococcaceae bacterium]